MAKNTVVFRLLVGLMLLASGMLSACTALSRAEAAPNEDPVLLDPPSGEGSEHLFIDRVEALISESSPVQVQVVIHGNLADGCTRIEEYLIEHEEGTDLFRVTVGVYRDPDMMCTMALVPIEENISLNVEGLTAGTYRVDVHGVTASFELTADNVSP